MASTLSKQYDSSKFFLTGINTLLQLINEPPIETEEDVAELLEAQIASDVIIETKKEVLAEGWDFNTDDGYSFPIDQNGFIPVGANVLDISATDGDIIMRDWRLYSKSAQSAKFEESQKMDVIWDMDFNSLTHPIRNYITIRAALKFQARQIMDVNLYSYTQRDAEEAFLVARRSEGKTGRYNMLSSGQYGSNASARL